MPISLSVLLWEAGRVIAMQTHTEQRQGFESTGATQSGYYFNQEERRESTAEHCNIQK